MEELAEEDAILERNDDSRSFPMPEEAVALVEQFLKQRQERGRVTLSWPIVPFVRQARAHHLLPLA